MPMCVFKCEGCNKQHAFHVQDEELAKVEGGDPIRKHCLTCHTMTNWVFALADRRRGADRRMTPSP
jgi:hypothetical protein